MGVIILAAEETQFILPHADELIWGSIAFVLLFVALSKFAFPKLKATLAARTERIRGQLESAEKSKTEADAVLEQYRAQLADARNEANRIIEEAKRTAESVRRDLVVKAEQEAAEIVTRARAEVGSERDRAMAELRSSVASLTINVAERVIGRELQNDASQRAFVDQTIAELSRIGQN
ncbi:MAG TPA: F0F1 ATP synthase subunit B [Actinomycetota bacterium]